MSILELCALGALGLLALEQVGASVIFAVYCHFRLRRPPANHYPEALIVLPLRGADHRLADCLRGVAKQDYPNYQVRLIIDRRGDPAEEIADRVLAELPAENAERMHVQFLREPRPTCSLKCSSLYEATGNLPEGCEVVATIDSDIVPHRRWLANLAAPLADPKVGAAMGNRWYLPSGNWGSVLCYVWNAPVVVSMFFLRVPWGGSLAVDAKILRDTDIRGRWLKAGCEDIPLANVLLRQRRALEFVPSLLMLSREDCSVSGCLRFINRQFVWTRLYHPLAWWSSAVLYSLATTAVLLGLALGAQRALAGELLLALLLAGAAVGFLLVEALMLTLLELTARRMLAAHGETSSPMSLKTFWGVALTQMITPLLFLRSFLCRRIGWRGIDYEIRGAWKVRMVAYEPYNEPPEQTPTAPVWTEDRVTFPNLLSRLVMKREFARQFIVPAPPPLLLEQFLIRYERFVLRPDLSQIAIERPIFLVGLHRSGTTLLQDLLCLHPQVGYINNAMPSFRRCFCAAEHVRQRLGLDFRGQRMLGDSVEITAGSPNEGVAFWREWLGEDHHDLSWPGLTMQDLSDSQIEHIRTSIRKILWCYRGRATRFFCKNPSLLPHLELLADLFPDAKFVHIVRDARTCANSMVKLYRLEQAQLDRIRSLGRHGIYDTKPYVAFPRLPRLAEYVERFGADNIETTARLWNDALEEVERVKSGLPAFHEVRYEDILADPQFEIGRILEFCDLPPFDPEHPTFWQKLATVGRVQHTNRYADYERIEAICGRKLAEYGYPAHGAPVEATAAGEAATVAGS